MAEDNVYYVGDMSSEDNPGKVTYYLYEVPRAIAEKLQKFDTLLRKGDSFSVSVKHTTELLGAKVKRVVMDAPFFHLGSVLEKGQELGPFRKPLKV